MLFIRWWFEQTLDLSQHATPSYYISREGFTPVSPVNRKDAFGEFDLANAGVLTNCVVYSITYKTEILLKYIFILPNNILYTGTSI